MNGDTSQKKMVRTGSELRTPSSDQRKTLIVPPCSLQISMAETGGNEKLPSPKLDPKFTGFSDYDRSSDLQNRQCTSSPTFCWI
ncbi:hypothetical protein CRG98_039422 [Punica granatum]|uniref:Uncharacterized protein n=1 Tax=Punica granatum TaxID=22663 RepID=A0A2I0I926_PUNGR|nr:hypothetical protein CRG98_039422 [Punica granatum]